MLSVNYPPVYRSFTRNFAFSGGLVSWTQMQMSIDNFRSVTGGNLTADSVAYLRNATLVYEGSATSSSFSSGNATATKVKRAIGTIYYDGLRLEGRGILTSVNGSQSNVGGGANGTNSTLGDSKTSHLVHGIQAYAEQLTIPQSNTFMTVLLVFACAVAAVAVGILLFKLILELWALFRSFPKSLVGFRKRYWGFLGRTIVNMILLLYGIWTLYCVFQFTHGDSWAAKLLAGVTLAAFTSILGFFTFRIWQLARRYKKTEGDTSVLFEDKRTWRKYSLFYDQYKRDVWWLFLPVIVYMFVKGCIIAAGDGHGLVQTSGQLVVEALMLALLLWHRPYATKAGNWINIFIQVVRVLSVVCILIFVEELGVKHTTKTVTGVVLIAMQSTLTAALAILIAVNAFIICCRENPHRRRRKEAGEFYSNFQAGRTGVGVGKSEERLCDGRKRGIPVLNGCGDGMKPMADVICYVSKQRSCSGTLTTSRRSIRATRCSWSRRSRTASLSTMTTTPPASSRATPTTVLRAARRSLLPTTRRATHLRRSSRRPLRRRTRRRRRWCTAMMAPAALAA